MIKTMTPATAWINSHVVAEDAPIGVQVWPTRSPEFAPNFTIAEVLIVRNARGVHVKWIYENGAERYFNPGDLVFISTENPL